jgi:GNAT superfamily N-acetyltransferase
MDITIREAHNNEVAALIPILLQAEPSEAALRWGLAHLVDAVYRMDDGDEPVAAATMQWRDEPCELIDFAVAPERHGQGLGRQMLRWLADEARRRGKKRLLVGTPNSNLAAIAFYQKAGLRMDSVRRNYFSYYRKPVLQNGICVRDMLVFRLDLIQAEGSIQ